MRQAKADCIEKTSAEAAWADNEGGKTFGVGDSVSGSPPSNEIVVWNFCVGEMTLRPEHRQRLTVAATHWKQLLVTGAPNQPARGDLRISIMGTASPSGDTALNNRLAVGRAEAVASFLTSQGIPSQLIDIKGVGTKRPLADPGPPENMARNRRVEVFLIAPTTEVSDLGPAVAPDVSQLKIDKHPKRRNQITFDDADNQLEVRAWGAMEASTFGILTGIQGASLGLLQLLIADIRLAQYNSETSSEVMLLDFSRCISPTLPCRDVGDAADVFTSDHFPKTPTLRLAKTGSVAGTVTINDSPGVVFPMRYPTRNDPFVLTNYFWFMEFQIIAGVRDVGLFMPLQQARWFVTASQTVDVKAKRTTGMEPIAIHVGWQPGGSSAGAVAGAMSGPSCRFGTRMAETGPQELPCRPNRLA
ncbi:MAG: OmpA family protein [Actinomycetota bacterium]|nr:OmpA family protein [Actinomycetota bacterium]